MGAPKHLSMSMNVQWKSPYPSSAYIGTPTNKKQNEPSAAAREAPLAGKRVPQGWEELPFAEILALRPVPGVPVAAHSANRKLAGYR